MQSDSEQLQRMLVEVLASQVAGEGLCLIGGFRYRLLDDSCRRSMDIDYHLNDGLAEREAVIVDCLRRHLLPTAKRRLGYAGRIMPHRDPANEMIAVRRVDCAFWPASGGGTRIEIPVDLTRIPLVDQAVVRTRGGRVYLVASDADAIEAKVVALLNRIPLRERDFVDLFLFHGSLPDNARERLAIKFEMVGLNEARRAKAWASLRAKHLYHSRMIDRIIDEQVDAAPGANLKAAGGGAMIYNTVCDLVARLLGLPCKDDQSSR